MGELANETNMLDFWQAIHVCLRMNVIICLQFGVKCSQILLQIIKYAELRKKRVSTYLHGVKIYISFAAAADGLSKTIWDSLVGHFKICFL